jgi:hypothetical protein
MLVRYSSAGGVFRGCVLLFITMASSCITNANTYYIAPYSKSHLSTILSANHPIIPRPSLHECIWTSKHLILVLQFPKYNLASPHILPISMPTNLILRLLANAIPSRIESCYLNQQKTGKHRKKKSISVMRSVAQMWLPGTNRFTCEGWFSSAVKAVCTN